MNNQANSNLKGIIADIKWHWSLLENCSISSFPEAPSLQDSKMIIGGPPLHKVADHARLWPPAGLILGRRLAIQRFGPAQLTARAERTRTRTGGERGRVFFNFYIIFFPIYQKYMPKLFFKKMSSCRQFIRRTVGTAGWTGGKFVGPRPI